MTIIDSRQASAQESFPGIDRRTYVNGEMGAESLSVMDLVMSSESTVPTHTHPTEEAMVVLEGQLEAVIGDQVVTVQPGQTILASAGVPHGLTNKSGADARIMAIFPTGTVERTLVD